MGASVRPEKEEKSEKLKKIVGVRRLYMGKVFPARPHETPSRYSGPSSRFYTVETSQERRKRAPRLRFLGEGRQLFRSGEI
jgi:hypothetical protein